MFVVSMLAFMLAGVWVDRLSSICVVSFCVIVCVFVCVYAPLFACHLHSLPINLNLS